MGLGPPQDLGHIEPRMDLIPFMEEYCKTTEDKERVMRGVRRALNELLREQKERGHFLVSVDTIYVDQVRLDGTARVHVDGEAAVPPFPVGASWPRPSLRRKVRRWIVERRG